MFALCSNGNARSFWFCARKEESNKNCVSEYLIHVHTMHYIAIVVAVDVFQSYAFSCVWMAGKRWKKEEKKTSLFIAMNMKLSYFSFFDRRQRIDFHTLVRYSVFSRSLSRWLALRWRQWQIMLFHEIYERWEYERRRLNYRVAVAVATTMVVEEMVCMCGS